LRLAAHVIEIVGADREVIPSDIPLILLRPVNKRDAHAAVEEITCIRNIRREIYGTVTMDEAIVDPDGGRRVRDTEVEVLRTEARFILCGGLEFDGVSRRTE
jgi:hypothetical protein